VIDLDDDIECMIVCHTTYLLNSPVIDSV
jgi:hypothetical protein